MRDLWDSLFDSQYDGVNLIVTLLGCAIFFGALFWLRNRYLERQEIAEVAPVRPPEHFRGGGTPETSLTPRSAPQNPGIGNVFEDEDGDRFVWTGNQWMPILPGGPRSFYPRNHGKSYGRTRLIEELEAHGIEVTTVEADWDSKKIHGIPDPPFGDLWVQMALYGIDSIPDIDLYIPRRGPNPLAEHSMILAAAMVPGMKGVIAAASEEQQRSVFRQYVAEHDQHEVELYGEPKWGETKAWRVVPAPPYDWQRDDSGLV